MLWLVPYLASPFIASLCLRRWWHAIIAASAVNVPIMGARLLWLESQLGNPPDFDMILAISIGIWTMATLVFNCLIIAIVRGTMLLFRKSTKGWFCPP